MKKIKKRIRSLILIISTIVLSFVISSYDRYFEISKNLDIFATLYQKVNLLYVDEVKPGELMKTGIDAMLNSLDPYTNFIPEAQLEEYKFMTTGQYGGIGALIRQRDDYVMISEVYEGYPAQRAGLLPGDKILEIDGKQLMGKSTSEISDFLKGSANSTVNIKLERGSGDQAEVIAHELNREEIKIKDVPYYGMTSEGIGYIKLTGFTRNASREFRTAFSELSQNNELKGVVIDLRGNGGGLLNEAVNIVNTFVDRGQVIVSTKGKYKDKNRDHVTLNTPLDQSVPVAVLVNGGSASASEIVAGSLQDLDRGVIVGENTFGKGLVQETVNVNYNSILKVTVAKYYIPSGRCIQRIDYSHRNENGEAESVPDSLISEFYSLKNKRPLFDGAGILPDVEVENQSFSSITHSLLLNSVIFDYVNDYRLKHSELRDDMNFKLSEAEFGEFRTYVEKVELDYTTESQEVLNELKETAKSEKYFEDAIEEYEALSSKLVLDKMSDVDKFKDEIIEILEGEIIARYHYQNGRLVHSLKHDEVLARATEALNDSSQYYGILKGRL